MVILYLVGKKPEKEDERRMGVNGIDEFEDELRWVRSIDPVNYFNFLLIPMLCSPSSSC